jgi:hypothetical protein
MRSEPRRRSLDRLEPEAKETAEMPTCTEIKTSVASHDHTEIAY